MRQRAVIKKLLQNKAEVYYKVRQAFNIVLAIKKCDCYYKVWQTTVLKNLVFRVS